VTHRGPFQPPPCCDSGFFRLATGSAFPVVPPLDLCLSRSQQPELPAQRSQAPSPARGVFLCWGLDVPEPALRSRCGTPGAGRAGVLLLHSDPVQEPPSPTRSPSPGLARCARGRRVGGSTGDALWKAPPTMAPCEGVLGSRSGGGRRVIESRSHRVVWVGRDLKDHLIPTPLPWAGTPSTRPGCSEPHPTWPWTLPGRGQPQLLWATWARASPPSV